MFRRKDELDIDADIQDVQGSLLGEESETVSVLSPQKAAEYQAEKKQESLRQENTGRDSFASSNANASPTASFSSPSTFGQPARPLSTADVARPSNTNKPSAPAATTSLAANNIGYRPAADANRFRSQEPAKPIGSSSNFNYESNNMLHNKPNPNERVLTVGNDILLKGEITTCDRLVIEGKVDATVSDVHTMELAAAGSFRGNAEVEYAEISGVFEGDLVVKTSLVIHQTGRVSGNISYGEIEIARGGSLTGEIKTISGSQARSNKEQKAA